MGEFAYRDGPWKLVYKMSGRNLEQSRGKPTIAELYKLDTDIAETDDLAAQRPEVVRRMTAALQTVIDQGATREGLRQTNDAVIGFETTQLKRWLPIR
jgi:hypothetical protein